MAALIVFVHTYVHALFPFGVYKPLQGLIDPKGEEGMYISMHKNNKCCQLAALIFFVHTYVHT